MADALSTFLATRNPQTFEEQDRALREIAQEFMLLGLWRAKFFEKAAFYGGTALRLLYGLDRFSEDLDFSLLIPDPDFRFDPYFDSIVKELTALGLDVEMERREKDTTIESAFLKMNTKMAMIRIGVSPRLASSVAPNRLIKVKFEADIDPPSGFRTESRLITEPLPIGIRAYSGSSMFAGKFHALLARSWKSRVKGRDWYDLVFFVRRRIPLDLGHLRNRLAATGSWSKDGLCAAEARRLLLDRIETLDVDAAKDDVSRFVSRPADLEIWSKDFFREIAALIEFEEEAR